MGNRESKATSGQEVYCLRQREVHLISEIWKLVETDLVYYGTQFYALLFHKHPEYFKYFQQNVPHEFQVDLPAMRTKFSLTCSTLAALFVDYSHKSEQREHLLGYVGMVHKDMNLTQKDMENFMMVIMEMLMKNFPKLMTADCCLAYMRYTASLTSRIHILMKRQREMDWLNKGLRETPKTNSTVGCFRSSNFARLLRRNEHLIYGRPAEYWEKKSRNWIVQRAVWATMYGKEGSDTFRNDIISMNSIGNTSGLSSSEDSIYSQAVRNQGSERPIKQFISSIHQRSTSSQDMKRQKTRRKKPFRKQKYFSILSMDDMTDIDAEIASRSSDFGKGDIKSGKPQVRESSNATDAAKTGTKSQSKEEKNSYRANEANRGRLRRVSIVNSTARERRRRKNREEINAGNRYPRSSTRRLTIQNGIGTVEDEDSSSREEIRSRDISSSLSKSLNVGSNRMKNRGTSISNVSNRSDKIGVKDSVDRSYADQRPRTSFSAKNDLRSSIIGSGTSAGRNAKANKRVSISNAHWIASSEFYK